MNSTHFPTLGWLWPCSINLLPVVIDVVDIFFPSSCRNVVTSYVCHPAHSCIAIHNPQFGSKGQIGLPVTKLAAQTSKLIRTFNEFTEMALVALQFRVHRLLENCLARTSEYDGLLTHNSRDRVGTDMHFKVPRCLLSNSTIRILQKPILTLIGTKQSRGYRLLSMGVEALALLRRPQTWLMQLDG
ncbi:hypothetical protein BD410DRAFT_795978 [Rickenella mellea]|uniref:Uncharacterized protein n=1 Tax=Rickenella mellea TaxID=50990 RepID=A0A4Y7PKB9_9AGAM|nr:hypothetical protein BD410DRAFT_795978 [Rickenella mellea]